MSRLEGLPLHDRARAEREIAGLQALLPPLAANRADLLLAASPDPEGGLNYFTRLAERRPAAFVRLALSTAGLRYLTAIVTHSEFLAEEILEHPEWAEELIEGGTLHRALTPEDLRARLDRRMDDDVPRALLLAQFRRQQILRILVRDVLGLGTLAEITSELSALADAITGAAYDHIHRELTARFGTPQSEAGEAGFAVIALGKLGGQELNYSSDIDLMFLYSANGETTGPARITNKEFFKRAANQLTALLSTYTAEGLCYRVDLRLRPDGSLGEVCLSLDGARQYYAARARDWELQMLIKARVAAGDRATGNALLDFIEPRIYATTLDFSAIEALSATRERLNEKLASKLRASPRPIDVKLDRGGIRDIEFLVQCLQRLHGGAEPWVRHGGTLLALSRLRDKGFVSMTEYSLLASSYHFLRHLEHRLQLAGDRQTHALPTDPDSLELLARRMPGGGSSKEMLSRLHAHLSDVMGIYDLVVHASSSANTAEAGLAAAGVSRAVDQRAPEIAALLSRHPVSRGFRAFEHFLERLDPMRLSRLNEDAGRTAKILELFEMSPHFGEELIRSPELGDEVDQPSGGSWPPNDMAELRRWYRRQMLRIQAASVCNSQPIFETLEATSALADTVLAASYDIALNQILASHPPNDPGYVPSNQLLFIALGRLGMREFDLASDADVIFVLADSDEAHLDFWRRVAQRLVDLVTAYTGDGVLFSVDTRLRPNGSGGALVSTESAVEEYFTRAAETWEGITYMKARGVGGDPKRAEAFLHRLQDVDWRRYGQSGRSRTDLRQMRMRLEKEQGASHPLKAGRGGYYDIDFLLMYLRLKSAGIFYTVLNTPERIEVLETMGHLDREQAQFLHDAARFYRALDHAMRVLSGHADERLPSGVAQIEMLRGLLARWTPIPLDRLAEVREKTRACFDRLFA